jgi:surface antigen
MSILFILFCPLLPPGFLACLSRHNFYIVLHCCSQAARLLAALSAAQPSSAASLLRTAAEDLRQATAQMASLAAPYGAKHYLPTSMASTQAAHYAQCTYFVYLGSLTVFYYIFLP